MTIAEAKTELESLNARESDAWKLCEKKRQERERFEEQWLSEFATLHSTWSAIYDRKRTLETFLKVA